MPSFTVYLPPIGLSLLPINKDDPPLAKLEFITLPPPVNHDSLDLSESLQQYQRRLQRHESDFRTSQSVPAATEQPGEAHEEGQKIGRSGDKRQVSPSWVEPSGKTSTEWDESLLQAEQPPGESQDKRRRSKRLRSNGSLLGTMPQLEVSESIMSLNTTTSNPSQFLGNDTEGFHLPTWHVPLSKLTSLQSLLFSSSVISIPGRQAGSSRSRRFNDHGAKQMVSLIVCVMNVETSVCRQRKEEKARGQPGTLWIGGWTVTGMPTSGTEEPVSCGVKLWDSCARELGDNVVRKGDVVLLENVEWKNKINADPAQIVLSPGPTYTPKPTILYRTLPRYTQTTRNDYAYQSKRAAHAHGMGGIIPEDRMLRPDLGLARSDPGTRKVMEIAKWFAGWIGGEPPP